MKAFISQLKALPGKNKRLIGLGVTIFLFLSIPLLIWGFLTGNFNLREKAGGPVTPPITPPDINTSIYWRTDQIEITADEFYIESNGKIYTGRAGEIFLSGGNIYPVTSADMLVTSNKYGDDLRILMKFKNNGNIWWADEVRIYNSNYSDQWLSYRTTLLNSVPLGNDFSLIDTYHFNLIDPYTNNVVAIVHFTNLRIKAFPQPMPIITPTPVSSPEPTPTPAPTASPAPKEGDVNGDGLVNIVDIGIIIDNYRIIPITDLRADLNNDGTVNIVDIGIVINNYRIGEN
jgi:hypothetical protein